ncbi:BamA/TamA family outer membrane protein [Millionella massiliensis]|uniref:hypothetical protein n=1 Tax=Millionella massiliensis TaxID=1871023 RepID=UPI0011600277|nr:hypothetical protein [Millionella massiliensis]
MCRCRHIAFTLFLFSLAAIANGQTPPSTGRARSSRNYDEQIHSENAIVPFNYREQSEKADAFYDTLRMREYKNPLTRFLFRSLIRAGNSSDEGMPSLDFKQNRRYFEQFSGKRISAIHLTHANVFSPRDSSVEIGWLPRLMDKIHIPTRKKQLMQNLLFEVGDTVNPYAMGINEELLRNLPNLATAYFVVMEDPNDSTAVTVSIFARDNWSISADVKVGSIDKRLAVFDRNFLGLGDELKLTFSSEQGLSNIGTQINYTARNLLGSFTDVALQMGVGANCNSGQFSVDHPFILPSDWGYGINVGRTYAREDMTLSDTSYYINKLQLGGWGGKSWCLNWRNGTSIYTAVSLTKEQFMNAPPLSETLNPYYHNDIQFLVSVGVARRNYFQGNMIYGYGRTEDLPYGFRAELIGGRQWDVWLGARDYWGLRFYWGNLLGNHYLEGGVALGSYFTSDYTPQQSVIKGQLKYFSPLVRLRTNYIRQFLQLSTTMGFNRLEGEREALRYEKQQGLGIRGLSANSWMTGYNRMTLSTETVLFTPLYLYQFRFAFFLFGDAGWLGYNNNIFRNRFTGAIGAGVRIKNERLIFNNIEIRLGYAFNRPPEVGYSYFSISNEQNFEEGNFAPRQPQIIPYQ